MHQECSQLQVTEKSASSNFLKSRVIFPGNNKPVGRRPTAGVTARLCHQSPCVFPSFQSKSSAYWLFHFVYHMSQDGDGGNNSNIISMFKTKREETIVPAMPDYFIQNIESFQKVCQLTFG